MARGKKRGPRATSIRWHNGWCELNADKGHGATGKSAEAAGRPNPGGGPETSNAAPAVRAQPSSLAAALAIYGALVVLAMTWAPFTFAWPHRIAITFELPPTDLLLNVVLFVPLGFFFQGALGAGRSPLAALGAGLLLSTVIELGQLLIVERYTSVHDLWSNGAGAFLGAVLYARLRRLLYARLRGQPMLGMPLTALLYLLTLLCWLNGLAARAGASRLLLAIFPLVAGLGVLLALWRRRVVAALPRSAFALALVAWLGISMLPGLFVDGRLAALLPLLVGFGLWRAGRSLPPGERRFERGMVLRVIPLLGVFLALAAYWPPTLPGAFASSWRLARLTRSTEPLPTERVLVLLESLGGFALLGYLVAQVRGRLEESRKRLGVALVLTMGSAVALFEGLRGFHPRSHASYIEALVLLLAGLFGAVIYREQLQTIRRLLAHGASADPLHGARGTTH